MEQLNLLELAKQGEPTAIASLMNAVLSPKGITARARMDQTCLYIFLESQKGLNQETLITFIQRGLLELGTESIHSVRLQARKSGDEAITWAREFSLQPTPTIVTFPPIEASAKERDAERDQKSEVAIEEELLPASVATLTPLGELIEQLDEASEATIAEESGQESPSSAVAISLPAIDLIELPDEASEAEIEEFEEEALSFRGWLKTRWRTYAIPVALVVVGGFVVGGTTAFWSTSQSQGSVEAGVKPH
ncbi:MAG TPA: hypothetical protein VL134_08120, partial [Leptolyngbya sp.]|nr:hypothetical protein [Leptolyngbya sp.]